MLWTVITRTRESNVSRIRVAIVVAVVAHVLAFLFAPPFEPRPYVYAQPPDTTVVVDLDDAEEYVYESEIQSIDDPVRPDPMSPPDPIPTPPPPAPIPGEADTDAPVMGPRSGSRKASRFVIYDRLPVLVESRRPSYPQLAREAGIEGTVLVEVWVGDDGRVKSARVLHSSAPDAMERASLAAVRTYRFEPARQGTRAVPARVVIPFEFRLDR